MDWKNVYPAANFNGVNIYFDDKPYCTTDTDDLDEAVEDFCEGYGVTNEPVDTIIIVMVELWKDGDVVDAQNLILRVTENGLKEE